MMIEVHDLWKSYGSLQVLKGLTLSVPESETLVILGRSGVGKSVLLRQIIGIESADQGYVKVHGKNLNTMKKDERDAETRQMGMLFQGGALFDSMSVGENVAFYLRQHDSTLPEKDVQERIAHSLAMVGLEGTQGKMPADLSGGMRKRAALARVIAYRPKIVLYDEPTTGLDPITAMQINDLIKKTRDELKSTNIVVTHDIRSALEVGDYLAFHDGGKIAHIAPRNEFFSIDDPLIQQFFENAAITESLKRSPHSCETK